MENKTTRLDKFLSGNGFVSRRGVKTFLKTQTVTVNGDRVRESGVRINRDRRRKS